MTFDSLLLHWILKEIAEALVELPVRQVELTDKELNLCFAPKHERLWLKLCWAPEQARMTLSSLAPQSKQKTSSGPQALLEKRLLGAVLQSAQQVAFDRIAKLNFGPPPEADQGTQLVAELMGRWSNALLLNPKGTILWTAKTQKADKPGAREVRPGAPYIPFTSEHLLNPLTSTAEEVKEVVASSPQNIPLKKLLRAHFQGMSRPLVEELEKYVSEKPREDLPASLSAAFHALRQKSWLNQRLKRIAQPSKADMSSLSEPEATIVPISTQTERLFSLQIKQELLQQTKTGIQKTINSARNRLKRRIQRRQRDLLEAEKAEDYRKWGELLLANLKNIPKGAEKVKVPDWYDEASGELEILLDPTLTPLQNAQRFFRQHRKAKTMRRNLPQLLASDHQEQACLKQIAAQVEATADEDQLETIKKKLEEKGYLLPKVRAERQKRRPTLPRHVRIFENVDGFRVLIGTSAEGNEYLLRHASSPNDIWLHTRGIKGAHAIIKTDRHPERVPQQVIIKAASLAAYFSAERGASSVPVDYTLRKFVRRPKATPPAFVTYQRATTLFVQPQAPKSQFHQ